MGWSSIYKKFHQHICNNNLFKFKWCSKIYLIYPPASVSLQQDQHHHQSYGLLSWACCPTDRKQLKRRKKKSFIYLSLFLGSAISKLLLPFYYFFKFGGCWLLFFTSSIMMSSAFFACIHKIKVLVCGKAKQWYLLAPFKSIRPMSICSMIWKRISCIASSFLSFFSIDSLNTAMYESWGSINKSN